MLALLHNQELKYRPRKYQPRLYLETNILDLGLPCHCVALKCEVFAFVTSNILEELLFYDLKIEKIQASGIITYRKTTLLGTHHLTWNTAKNLHEQVNFDC